MMRQLGGAFGVALISTFVTRQTDAHRATLVAHLDPTTPQVQARIAMLTAGLHDRQKALALLDAQVTKQATVLSYMDVFLWVGVLFVICVPFVLLFIKTAKNKVSLADAAH